MDYQRFDPGNCGFPRPKVPILPSLSWQSLGREDASPFGLAGSGAQVRHFTRGRYALTEAYRQAGVGEQGALLAPAYHCRTMLDPAIRLGAEVALYALKPDLSPDLMSLKTSLAACRHPVKALLVAHYFGFAQALEPLLGFCSAHNITLIEDCSHALLSKTKSGTMGETGRFAVASPYKFFPAEDGGLLWANGGHPLAQDPTCAPTLMQELKGMLHSAQHARAHKQVPDVALIDIEIKTITDKLSLTGRDEQEQSAGPSPNYRPTEESMKSLAWSRWVMRHTNVQSLIRRRRHNYEQWAAAVAKLPHCRALFPQLTADCVPYMFPLQIDHPEVHFFALKQLGVPIWRWDDMAVSSCPVASSYRLKMIHLPCHQELSEQQMAWLTAAVQKVMLQISPGRPS
ncbi:MAG: DegT/DnrJ/EryC1/StrS family aminotransferase [Polaromonas sp.]